MNGVSLFPDDGPVIALARNGSVLASESPS